MQLLNLVDDIIFWYESITCPHNVDNITLLHSTFIVSFYAKQGSFLRFSGIFLWLHSLGFIWTFWVEIVFIIHNMGFVNSKLCFDGAFLAALVVTSMKIEVAVVW